MLPTKKESVNNLVDDETKGRLRKHQRYLDANSSHNTTIRLEKENQGQHQNPNWIQQRHP